MSDYNVISDVDKTLKELLWANIQHDSVITAIIKTEQQITFNAPYKLVAGQNQQDSLSLYLYRIIENGEIKNRPLELRDKHTLNFPPLPLNLFYLVTPLSSSVDNDHRLLGKTVQTFYDNAIVRGAALQGGLQNTTEELRIILNQISLEDITKIWSSFMCPYRLSLSYEVKVIAIDSGREIGADPVLRKKLEFTNVAKKK
jgi:hypothetical protein